MLKRLLCLGSDWVWTWVIYVWKLLNLTFLLNFAFRKTVWLWYFKFDCFFQISLSFTVSLSFFLNWRKWTNLANDCWVWVFRFIRNYRCSFVHQIWRRLIWFIVCLFIQILNWLRLFYLLSINLLELIWYELFVSFLEHRLLWFFIWILSRIFLLKLFQFFLNFIFKLF